MRVVVIGCGVIGAAIAYHLTNLGLSVTVIEKQAAPGQVASSAALGILMAISSLKLTGDVTILRLRSQELYQSWLPQLREATGQQIVLREGLLCLPKLTDRDRYENLIRVRQEQGYPLQWLTPTELAAYGLPQVSLGLYSPKDRALSPQSLVTALVTAATAGGAEFIWETSIDRQDLATLDADRLVVAAGVGTSALVAVPLQGVGGQGIQVRVAGLPPSLPIVHGIDGTAEVNIVPLGNQEYWIGATVEYEPQALPTESNTALLLDRAAQWFPPFAQAKVTRTWGGYRPRPIDRPAPVIGFLPHQNKVIVASGHFRSGVLLAPITAQIVGDLILTGDSALPWRTFAPRIE